MPKFLRGFPLIHLVLIGGSLILAYSLSDNPAWFLCSIPIALVWVYLYWAAHEGEKVRKSSSAHSEDDDE